MNFITLTLNPAFDIHCYIKNFSLGKEHLVDNEFTNAGGKGVNISKALSSVGVESNAIIVLAKDNKDLYCKSLNHIKYTPILTDGRIRENLTIHTETGEETRVSFKGFSADDSLLDKVFFNIENELSEDTVVTFTGSVPIGISTNSIICFLKKISNFGCKIVIDSNSFKKLSDITELKPWLIKPNFEEISQYLGVKSASKDEILTAAKNLHKSGVENVIVSLGKDGAILICKEGAFLCKPPIINTKSTIGAGDSLIAGFISACNDTLAAKEALKRSVAFGTAACLREGTLPPLSNDIDMIFKNLKITRI